MNEKTNSENKQLFIDIEDSKKQLDFDMYITELRDVNRREIVEILAN